MEIVATNVPPESELLCESCGYRLSGLPDGANCPECGHNTAESAVTTRSLTAWERAQRPSTFFSTTTEILFHPKRFYRSLRTRNSRQESRKFGLIHLLLASLLFGIGEYVHVTGFLYFDNPTFISLLDRPIIAWLVFSTSIILLLILTTPLAVCLTSWEARYRGLRLPFSVILRGLDYHAAHYLPVAIVSTLTIIGYRWLIDRGILDPSLDAKYLYVLCGEVIVGAVYLFNTYWIGMRNMMYANA